MSQELWRQLHAAEGDQKLSAARELLSEAPADQISWLFEWLAGVVFKKNQAVPKEGSQLLCDVLDALPKSYPLHSHASWLLALPLRSEFSGAPALLERLLKRPPLAFHPSVEQAMAIFQKMSLAESSGLRLLLRALESAAPKKAFRAVLDALPIFAGAGETMDTAAGEAALLAVLVQPSQLTGFEALAATWEAGTERQAAMEVYQAQLFSCLTKMMAEETTRRGCCRLLVPFFAGLVKAFARQRAKEQARQEREKVEEKPKTSVEFLVLIQLWTLLKPQLKVQAASSSDVTCACLTQLWRVVRSHSLYRPREDQKGLQSKTLSACCGLLLKRLENHGVAGAAGAEWSCLEELLQLDVAPFESRLPRLWLLLTGPQGDSPAAGQFAAKVVTSYGQLADLSSCLEALNEAIHEQGASSPLLTAPEFVQGLEEASGQLTALGQITGTWKMFLRLLKAAAETASREGWQRVPGCCAVLRCFLAGLKPNELCLQPMRELFHETYDLLNSIEPWPASMDGLLLALCLLGRRLCAWELPQLLAEPSSTFRRSQQALERLVQSSHGEAAAACLRLHRDAGTAQNNEVIAAAIQQAERDFAGPSTSSPSRCQHVSLLARTAGPATKLRSPKKRKRRGDGDAVPHLERLAKLVLPEVSSGLSELFFDAEALLESAVQLRGPLLQRLQQQLQDQFTESPTSPVKRRRGAVEPNAMRSVRRLRVLQQLSQVLPVTQEVLPVLRQALEAPSEEVVESGLLCLAEVLQRTAPEDGGLWEDFEETLQRVAQRTVGQATARALGLCSKALRRQGKVKKQSLAQLIGLLLGQDAASGDGGSPRWRLPTPREVLRGVAPGDQLPKLLAFLEGGSLGKLDGLLELELQNDSQEACTLDLHTKAVAAAQLLQVLGKDVGLRKGKETKISWTSFLPDVLLWMKENPGGHLKPLSSTVAQHLEQLCKGDVWTTSISEEELTELLLSWAELRQEEEAQDSFACLELWAKRSKSAETLLERLSIRICSLPNDAASLRPLGLASARFVRGLPRSTSITSALAACQRLLGAAEDPTQCRSSLLLSSSDLLLALFERSAPHSGGGRGRPQSDRRAHPQLSQLEALLLSSAQRCALSAPGDPTTFSALTTCASNLLSALFKAVPLESQHLPLWVERPHLLQDALRAMLEAVYAAPAGALACRVAQDLTRLWEALSQGGTRQAVQSGGRTGLTTYQAKVQRAITGFALPLLSHALDQQRRFEGAEAKAKRCGAAGGRLEEVAAWKEAVSILQQGSTTLLNSLEGADHLLQGLYAALREPLRSMFKELHSGWQKHGRYHGET